MNEGRRLQRLTRVFLGHLLCREPPQLLVDQRQKLLGRLQIALLNGAQNSRDIGHAVSPQTAQRDP